MKKAADFEIKKKEPPFAMYDQSGKRIPAPKFDPSVLKRDRELVQQKEEQEKAPIAESGSGTRAWAEIGPNLHIKYEVPSFDRGGGINVLVSGKMPYTLGHHVYFSGVLESAGIGDIFTMDHDLIASLRKFVYQEMPRIDKFSKDILDGIYSDTTAEIGMNVPIKSIYAYLRANYPKEFAKATRGKNVEIEQLSEVITKQKQFYNRKTNASALTGMTKTAYDEFGDDEEDDSMGSKPIPEKTSVSISYQELAKIDKKLAEKIRNDKPVNDFFIAVKEKSDGKVLIVAKNSKGNQLTYIVPRRVLKKFKKKKSILEMQEELDRGLKKQEEGEAAGGEKTPGASGKFLKNESMTGDELKQLFIGDAFESISSQDVFNKALGRNRYKKTIINLYDKLSDQLSGESKKKFLNFKSSTKGQALGESGSVQILEHLIDMDYEDFKAAIDGMQQDNKKAVFDTIAKNEDSLDKGLVMNSIRYKVAINPNFLNDTDKTLLLKNYDEEQIIKENPKMLPIIIDHKMKTKQTLSDFEINYAINNHADDIASVVNRRPEDFQAFYDRMAKDDKLKDLPFDFKKYMMSHEGKGHQFFPQEKNDPAYKELFGQQQQQQQPNVAKISNREIKISNREIKISKREK